MQVGTPHRDLCISIGYEVIQHFLFSLPVMYHVARTFRPDSKPHTLDQASASHAVHDSIEYAPHLPISHYLFPSNKLLSPYTKR